ncbi:SCO6880 family protein [uncultured Pseudokineococcus sp.]|uniref:SCO6880 family protein n=1 Tax=uncultured Pseudokineococcus sp. TaxID=1642928 RepID=UPI0026364BEB|nr:SCO6880 family protein [uncultured Pseudokineococcus sp.]
MAVAERSARTYGNWRRPLSAGIGSFGLIGTTIVFAGFIAMIVANAVGGLVPAVVTALVALAALGVVVVRDRHGHSIGQRVVGRVAWANAQRLGGHLYRSGPLGRTRWGTHQLPGLLAASALSEHEDSYGRSFALLHVPATGHYSLVLATEPEGSAGVDADQVDSWVANWGAWLASLGDEPGLVAVSVTIETAPDTGTRLRREIALHADPDAPAVAQAILAETARTAPEGAATVRAWVALTFTAAAGPAGGRRRKAAEVGHDLAARLPGISGGLEATGGGVARPLSAQGLCEVVRGAFDPHAGRLIEEAHAVGATPELSWTDVGPTATQSTWDTYRHDSGVSCTWSMTVAPRGTVRSSVLEHLLAPHARIDRKRVTLLYRPVDSARAARIVEQDKRNADVRATSTRRPSSRVLVEQRAATATADEEAAGAGLLSFGMLVTATVTDPARLEDAKATVDNLAATARLSLRPVYGSQDSAFAAALPLGLHLPAHLKVPDSIREAL